VTKVRAVELRLVGLPLVRPFRTSFGVANEKVCVLARVETDHGEGWGECVADIEPDFSPEWNESAWDAISRLASRWRGSDSRRRARRVASCTIGQAHPCSSPYLRIRSVVTPSMTKPVVRRM
jgi:L-alanine-DL-glutamate epimerase-like enolase superfamily enzyme